MAQKVKAAEVLAAIEEDQVVGVAVEGAVLDRAEAGIGVGLVVVAAVEAADRAAGAVVVVVAEVVAEAVEVEVVVSVRVHQEYLQDQVPRSSLPISHLGRLLWMMQFPRFMWKAPTVSRT